MEIVLGLALLAVVIWLVARRSSAARGAAAPPRPASTSHEGGTSQIRADIDAAVRRDQGASEQAGPLRSVGRRTRGDHVPPAPSGRSSHAWSPRTTQLEVAGEWYRADNLRALFSAHSRLSESGSEIRLVAVLVPDPGNPHDGQAVGVHVDGHHVGYMERADAARYHRAIAALPHGQLAVPSRQWLRVAPDDTWARVTLSLPPAEHLTCPNTLDPDWVLLPPGSTIQVTREEDHMDHLTGLLARYGSDWVLAAVLRSVVEQRPRSVVDVVAVDIDGTQVGVLSPTQTSNLLPLVRRAESEGRTVACRATLRGNSLKADVALHARKVHELDDDELEGLFTSS